MTADPPNRLPRGVHFDLARNVVNALEEQIEVQHQDTLLTQFQFDVAMHNGSRVDALLRQREDSLIELAEYLGVRVPGADGPVDPSAADIDAYSELVSAETALRAIIRIAVPNWIADLDDAAKAKLEVKRDEEDRRRDGIQVSQDLLDYTEIYQLQQIIDKHWDPDIRAILDDKKRTDVYLSIIFDIRNSIGHSRPVFASERLLLAGAAGQIRNQLARYKAQADGPQRHYPSLDSARDSMGTGAGSNPYFAGPGYGPRPPIPRLEVGDVITFELEGTDPRGRELVWTAYSTTNASSFEYSPIISQVRGDRVQITWTVSEDEVGENRQVAIVLANTGRYHRHRNLYDDACVFDYHVNPPPDA
ncbi:hypothetical protein PUR22_07580 [Mycolicibacterium porcinum]|uniref:hypothetical protein n=1 Tax=Mycolicibacterium porcinum TaxID=39693 RepID=UPI0031F8FB7D